ncbi:MAG TPA: hypothetical protein PLV68_12510 [Ilumatobacteraceae bacterium]|nr:hypothetical protein [Ilumatobacteraceae bacterium]
MTDWNTDDDAARVYYDLAEWDFDQQAELTSALAEADIPHEWQGTELVIPEEHEEITDAIFADVEQRLGILGIGTGTEQRTDVEAVEVRELSDDEPVTDYDLADWQEAERDLVGDSLAAANIPFRWQDTTLIVPTADEAAVDEILDDVESGEVISAADAGDVDGVPFESLNSFFLAGERLRKDPGDADGLERLVEALDVADPNRPPRGVELRVWRRSCELADRLADALIAGASDDPDEVEYDEDGLPIVPALQIASDLHDLLRPLI